MVAAVPATGAPDRATLGAFLGVVILGGINAIAVKVLVFELAPVWSASIRFVAAGVLLATFVLLARRAIPSGRSLAGAALYGAIAFSGSFAFITYALIDLPASTAMVFLALVPLETFALAILHRQERFQLQGLLGAVIALAGVAVVVADQLNAAVPLLSIAFMLVGTLFIAESGVILKWVPRSDPFGTNAVAMLTGGAILFVLSTLVGEAWALPRQSDSLLAYGYLVVLGSIGLFGLYLVAVRRWTASAVSYTTLLMPLVTLPLAAWLIGESVSVLFVIGSVLAILGVYVGAFLRIRPNRSSQTAMPECLPSDACGPPERVRRPAQAGGITR